jgi:hypothetical protein
MRNYFTRDRIIALALAGTAALASTFSLTARAVSSRDADPAPAPTVEASPVTTTPLSQADRCTANAIRVIEAAYAEGITTDLFLTMRVQRNDEKAGQVFSIAMIYVNQGQPAESAVRGACNYSINNDGDLGALDQDPASFDPAPLLANDSNFP